MHDEYDDYLYGDDEYDDEVLGLEDEILGFDDYDDEMLGLSFGSIGRGLARAGRFGGRMLRRGAGLTPAGLAAAALARRMGGGRSRGRRGVRPIAVRRARPTPVMSAPPLIPSVPGVNNNSKLYIPLGLGSFTFVNAGVTLNTFQTNPQKPVRPRRLWVDVSRSAGAGGISVDITDIKIGTKSMLGGAESIPAAQFAPDAFATKYQVFDSATPGTLISVFVSISASPGAGETIAVTVSFDCDSLG